MSADKPTSPHLDARGLRFAIVAARFNEAITSKLLTGANSVLEERHAASSTVFHVPGAFELPFAARKLALSGEYDAVIALGAVIRGGTPHFDYVAGEAARGLMQASLETGIPVIFGVLTTDNLEQAEARAGGEHGNKGADAALAAIEMACFNEDVSSAKRERQGSSKGAR